MQPSFPVPIQPNPAQLNDEWGPPATDQQNYAHTSTPWIPPQPPQNNLNYESNLSLNNNQNNSQTNWNNSRPPLPQMPQGMGPIPGFSDTGFTVPIENMMNNPMAAYGVEAGKQYFKQNMGGVFKWLNLDRLRYYFNVDNAYVLKKLKVLICPLVHKNWKREILHGGTPTGMQGGDPQPLYKPPRYDVNAPDLYIPTMAFLTYGLLVGYAIGTNGEFTPDLWMSIACSAVVILFLEVLIIKGGLFCLGCSPVPPMLDILSYSMYKYSGFIIEILVSLSFGNMAFYITCLVVGCTMALFMMRTLKARTNKNAGESYYSGATSKSTYFLLAIGVLQILLCYLMVYSCRSSTVESLDPILEHQEKWRIQQEELEKLRRDQETLKQLKEEQNQQFKEMQQQRS